MVLLYNTINEIDYSIESRALKGFGIILKHIFDPDDYDKEDLMIQENLSHYLKDIIALVSDGHTSEKLLSLDREELKDLIDFYDLPFDITTLDYPDQVLYNSFYEQWYLIRRNQKSYINDWPGRSIIEKITEIDVRNFTSTLNLKHYATSLNIDESKDTRKKESIEYRNYVTKISRNMIEKRDKENFNDYTDRIYRDFSKAKVNVSRGFEMTEHNIERCEGKDNSLMYARGKIKRSYVEFLTQDYSRAVVDMYENVKNDQTLMTKVMESINKNEEEQISSTTEINVELFKQYITANRVFQYYFGENMVICGGSVLDALSNVHNFVGELSDIDVCFYGADENKYMETLRRIIKRVPEYVKVYRKHNYIQVGKVQFILVNFKDIEEVMMNADFDISAFTFDGDSFYGTQNGIISLSSRVIIPFLYKYSKSTSSRIAKYFLHKSVDLYIPEFNKIDKTEINNNTYSNIFKHIYYLELVKLESFYDRGFEDSELIDAFISERINVVKSIKVGSGEAVLVAKHLIYCTSNEDILKDFSEIDERFFPIYWNTVSKRSGKALFVKENIRSPRHLVIEEKIDDDLVEIYKAVRDFTKTKVKEFLREKRKINDSDLYLFCKNEKQKIKKEINQQNFTDMQKLFAYRKMRNIIRSVCPDKPAKQK